MSLQQANKHTLSGLLNEGLYQIPDYQRRYSWEEKQNEELFNDLWDGFEANVEHYLGALSLCESDGLGKYSRYYIIDGQQRFTSLLILFSVIVNFDDNDEYTMDDLREIYKGKYFYFIEPKNQEEKEYFIAILEGKNIPTAKTKSQKCMLEAYSLYHRKLQEKINNSNKKIEKFAEKFANYVMKRTNFLIHLVPDEISANRMFESINDRGLPLKYFDKIKSFLLYASNKNFNNSLNDNIVKTFDKIYQFLDNKEYVLGINNDDNLLIYHFQSNPKLFESCWDYVKGKDNIYNDVKKHILNQETGDFIVDYLDDIEKFIDAVDKIEQKIKEENKKYIEFYRIFEPRAYMFPFTVRMEILDLLDENIDELIVINFWQRARKRQSIIMKELENIIETPYIIDNGRKLSKEQLLEKIKTHSSSNVNPLEEIAREDWAVKYILWAYSKEKCDQYISYKQYKELQIEHICPQNPASVKSLGWGVKEQYEKEIESIGNKLLLEAKINSKVSNKLPADKMSEYQKSKIKMNHNVKVLKKNDVMDRRKILIKFMEEYLINK